MNKKNDSTIIQFDPQIEKHRKTIAKKLKPDMIVPKKHKLKPDCLESIKENVTFLVLALLQDHQNELKCIRSDLQRGRLDIVMMGLNKRLS